VANEIHAIHEEVHQIVNEHIDAAHDDIASNEIHATVSLSSLFGQLDNDLTTELKSIEKQIDKLIDAVLGETIGQESNLNYAGVHVPILTDQIRADLADETGNAIMARLMGFAPEVADTQSQIAAVIGISPNPELAPFPPITPDEVPHAPFQPHPPNPAPAPAPAPVLPGAPVPSGPTTEPSGSAAPPERVIVEVVPSQPEVIVVEPPAVTVNVTSPPVSPGRASPPTPTPAPSVVSPAITINVARPEGEVPEPEPVPAPAPAPPLPTAPEGVRAILAPLPEWVYYGLRWDDSNPCRNAKETLQKYDKETPDGRTSIDIEQESNLLSSIFRGGVAGAKTFIDGAFYGYSDDVRSELFNANLKLTGDILGGYSGVIQTLNAIDDTSLPKKNEAWNMGLVLAQAHKGEENTGFPLTYLTTSIEYLFNYANPQFIPEQTELNDQFARGLLHEKTWSCLTRAHGFHADMLKPIVESKQPQPGPLELVQLWNRRAISEQKYVDLMARAGFGDPLKRAWWEQLAYFVPGPADLVRFLVRDVFDADVVKQYDYDKDFELKFYGKGGKDKPGPAAAWALSQGMTEDQFRYFWRSHWQIPSDTALYEMLHRLREGRAEVKAWDRAHPVWTPDQPVPEDGARPSVVTVEDVQRAIEVNDMAPTWVKPLIDISYHPINRTDALQGFQASVFSKEELREAMLDNGYSPTDADRLVKIQEALKEKRLRGETGNYTTREILKYYKEGLITNQLADAALTPMVIDPRTRADYLTLADAEVQTTIKRAQVAKIKRAYYTGWINDQTAKDELAKLQIPQPQFDNMVKLWYTEKTGRFKEPSAKMIIGWMNARVITPDQAYQRLINLGYVDADAQLMTLVEVRKEAQALDKEQKAEQKRKEKLFKDARAAAREDEKDKERREALLMKEHDKIQKELDKVRKQKMDLIAKEVKILSKGQTLLPSDVAGLNESVRLDDSTG
jgi:hypothetical protein